MKLRKPILDQISTLKNLPTLPHILLKLIKACNETRGSLKEVSQIIEKDPSLSSKILRLVNSAYYGLPRKVRKMENAVTLLGTTAIKNVAISASIYEAFKIRGNGLFNLKRYWWHSLKTAILAKKLSEKIGYEAPDEAFLTGLMHDIGRLVLWVNFKKQYRGLLELYGSRPELLLAGEIRLGATHCEVGAWLLEKWNLPSFMADAVLYHHEPLERIKDSFPLVQIIYVANALSRETTGGEDEPEKLPQEIFGLSESYTQSLMSQADEELTEVAKSLEIEIEPPGKPLEGLSEQDAEKHRQLVREVRDASILLGTMMNLLEAPDEQSTLKAVYQGLQILFDLQDILIFLYDREREGLVGVDLGENEKYKIVSGVFIPSKIEKSLLIRCLHRGDMLDSFSPLDATKGVIVDEQLIRFIGKDGMLCIPLSAHGDHVGVIVVGLDEVEFTHLSQQFGVLQMFSRQAATALCGYRLKKAQLNAVQSERLGASHEIARKVIHEINNPLSIIKNYLKILAMKLAEQDIAQDEIRIINEEIDRVAQILRDLLAFSDRSSFTPEPVDVNAILSDMVRLTKDPLFSEHGITIHTDLDPSLPPVRGDKNALKQVFINLIKNAAEALTSGGNIYIKTRTMAPDLDVGIAGPGVSSAGLAEITIADDGPGIPAEIRNKIFQPFASTKGGSHSGLGLSVVHNIVQALKGTIVCESKEGKGTSFKISLPLYGKETT
ncbi:MAG: hypothetical protein DRH12_05820 [Deltaproteobacteria bacterium]|nr:MAG: hypothetical protein DRH12_05820 [Deltaproteobacteria bacterium]